MAIFKPYQAKTLAELINLPIKDGQIIYLTDDKKIYLDVSDTSRVEITQDSIYEKVKLVTPDESGNITLTPGYLNLITDQANSLNITLDSVPENDDSLINNTYHFIFQGGTKLNFPNNNITGIANSYKAFTNYEAKLIYVSEQQGFFLITSEINSSTEISKGHITIPANLNETNDNLSENESDNLGLDAIRQFLEAGIDVNLELVSSDSELNGIILRKYCTDHLLWGSSLGNVSVAVEYNIETEKWDFTYYKAGGSSSSSSGDSGLTTDQVNQLIDDRKDSLVQAVIEALPSAESEAF